MDRILFLVITFTIIGNGTSLDFSQFHLPPCCYISPLGDPFSGYASEASNKDSVNTKRQVKPSFQQVPLIQPDSQNFTEFARHANYDYDSNEIQSNATTKRVYSFVVELDNIKQRTITSSTTQQPETTQRKPPTTGRILFPESNSISYRSRNAISKFKRNSNPIMDKTKLLEDVLSLELEDVESQTSQIGKKHLVDESENYLLSSATLQPEHRIKESDPIEMKVYENWEPKKIINRVVTSHSKPIPIRSHYFGKQENMLTSANSVKRQALQKMPRSWLKNLRKAIYQSIAAGTKPSNSNNQEASPQDKIREQQSSPKMAIIYPETWKSIQEAKLQFVDKMSQASSDINGAIFLPQGQGPVVSGVLVNTNEGGLQLRVASELYAQESSNDEVGPGCHCYLVNNGEILVAYWSVSRIFNENGLPALQYLVYPLPFSVPTPPDFIPFSNDPMFRPSQVDPLTNYYEQVNRAKYRERERVLEHQNQHHMHDQHIHNYDHNTIGNYQEMSHFERNPKFVHELPNSQHRIEVHNNPMQIPSPIPTDFGPGPEHAGVLIEQNRQYTPEFIEQYHAALQHHFQQQNDDQIRMSFHGTPFPNAGIDMPVNYQSNLPYPTEFMNNPQQFVQPRPQIRPGPTEFMNNPEQYVQPSPDIQPDPTVLPAAVQNDQISKPPTYPNSIQDIISPFSRPPLPPLSNAELGPPVLDVQQQPPQRDIHPGVNPQQFLNQEQTLNHNQPQNQEQPGGTPNPPTPNKNKDSYRDKETDNSYYDDKRLVDENYSQRPYTVSNVLDNEKKYYPRRKPSNYLVKSFSSDSKYKRRPFQNIDNAKGYLLDF